MLDAHGNPDFQALQNALRHAGGGIVWDSEPEAEIEVEAHGLRQLLLPRIHPDARLHPQVVDEDRVHERHAPACRGGDFAGIIRRILADPTRPPAAGPHAWRPHRRRG